MPGPSTSETNEVGGNGEGVSGLVEAADLVEVFGNDDSNDNTQGADSSSKSLEGMYKYSTLSFFSQSDNYSRTVWLIYLVTV